MQRALIASEHTGPPMKPHSAANKISPSAVHQKITDQNQVETLKKELSKSDALAMTETPVSDILQKKGSSTPGPPQKTQSTAVTQAIKVAKGPESDTQVSPTPGQKTPLDIPQVSGSQKPTDEAGQLELKQSKVTPDIQSGNLFGLSGPKTGPDAAKTTESVTGKMFSFGSSIFSSASTLISSAVQDESQTTPPGSRKMSAPAQVSPKVSTMPKRSPKSTPAVSPKMSPAREPKTLVQKQEQENKQENKAQSQPPKAATISQTPPNVGQATCPLCKAELNISSKDPPNYNTCTECETTVCTQCGFNPMPIGQVSNKSNYFFIYCMHLHYISSQYI